MATVPFAGLIAIGSWLGAGPAFPFTVVGAGVARGVRSRLGAEDEQESDRSDDQEDKDGQCQGQPACYTHRPAACS